VDHSRETGSIATACLARGSSPLSPTTHSDANRDLRKVLRGDFDREVRGFFTSRKGRYEIVEIMGLYWHFVDLVWVFIFALFYLW
jgi:hypothetical protein